jgi:RHS repeat-associated protein
VTVTTYDQNGTYNTTTTYAGFNVTMTNPKNQVKVDTSDVLGKVVKTTDAIGGVTQFSYDAFGNLTKTIDPSGNVITVKYDSLGRKDRLHDPNLGIIDYANDARGLVWNQVSPNLRAQSRSARTEYDLLGRMTARIEPDLQSKWVYDSAIKGIGQLATVTSSNGYERMHSYDGLGRPQLTRERLNDFNTYTVTLGYDSFGRPSTRTLSNTHGKAGTKTYQSRYNAQGHLAELVSGNTVLWKVVEQDASLRNKKVQYGNGLVETLTYDNKANRLTKAVLTTAGGAPRLNEAYEYDSLANVKLRVQGWDVGGFSEGFEYDDLNRIRNSTVAGQPTQIFSYDATGNIKSKTGVGTYTYPDQGAGVVRPHAVSSISSIAGGAAFGYDANGNLYTIPGTLTADWTSFDMPARITRTIGGVTTVGVFTYGPEHQRIRQDKQHDGSRVNYAGAQEVELSGNGTITIKTYLPHGVGVEIDRAAANATTATTTINYVHHDRLGSPVAITDEAGNIKERMAYDAWGKRRTLDGAAINGTPTPNSIDGVIDNRGFTGHEMLDHLDLVHMNGRVYEPLLGRFLSADPILQDPMNGQSYNRYAYVFNNPTNFTDPTGFSRIAQMELDRADRWMKQVVQAASEAGEAGQKMLETLAPRLNEAGLASLQGHVKNIITDGAEKNNAKNSGGLGGAIRNTVGAAVEIGIEQVGQRALAAKDILVQGATVVTYAAAKVTGQEDVAQMASDDLAAGGLKTASAALNLVTGGAQKKGSAVVNAVESKVEALAAKGEKTFQTYTKTNAKTGEVYCGRTSGCGTALENVAKRDGSHHMNDKGFGPAVLDKSSGNAAAIRGREQQVIHASGGARSAGGTSGNAINGISPNNPNRDMYLDAARKEFGQ